MLLSSSIQSATARNLPSENGAKREKAARHPRSVPIRLAGVQKELRMNQPFLDMRHITKTFPGVVANDGIDLQVEIGEVHGLLGENGAGKTTLMNILYGLLQPEEGEIFIEGESVTIRSPREAMARGIGMVHQHFMLVPSMTVAENVALGTSNSRLPASRLKDVSAKVTELSKRYHLMVDPAARIEDLSVGMQQRVEILKLLYRGARLLVLDEPTSVLTPAEWLELSAVMRSLVAAGRSAIFITHKLDELLSVADRCTVLRDGAVVGTIPVAQADKATLARMMVGREVIMRIERPVLPAGKPVLEVEGLSFEDDLGQRRLSDLTFTVREREILGVAGVDGNGQQELVEVLAGLLRPTTGSIRMNGEAASIARGQSSRPTVIGRVSPSTFPSWTT
jgi:ABC-type uncharacterized transport system ATPase subunit